MTSWQQQKKRMAIRKKAVLDHPINEYVDYIIYKTADHFKIKQEEMTSKYRGNDILIPRYIAIRIINDLTDLLDDVMFFFNRDRTTWYNVNEQIDDFVFVDKFYKSAYENIKAQCNQEQFKLYKEAKENEINRNNN